MTKVGKTNERTVVATLHREQANALVAYLNYKKYHWLTYGPLFRDVHLLLEDGLTIQYTLRSKRSRQEASD